MILLAFQRIAHIQKERATALSFCKKKLIYAADL
jgi:hypothetical protein